MNEELHPYPGLRAFDRQEWATFFGRESHIEELLQRLKDHYFLAVIGESGSGKSSLMKAGVLHALEQGYLGAAGQHWCIAELRPGDQPFEQLADALLADDTFRASWNPDGERQAAFLTAALRTGSRSLLELLQQHPLPSGTRLLLLVDQFEELFRYEVEAQAEPFVAMLLTACRARQDIYVAITMRSDFLGDTVAFQGLPEAINDGLYLTPRLNREQLHAAITHPALLAGGDIEDTLSNHLINEASTDPDQLPLLQHALMRLWQGATVLTLANYQATQNNLKNALDQHAEEVWRTLSPAQQSIAETVFRALTKRNHDGKEIRRPVKFATLLSMLPDGSEDDLRAMLNAYRRAGCNFLMPPPNVPLHADTTLDISHESLMRQWQKLKDWVKAEGEIAEQYARLRQDASQWQAQQGEMWQGKNLEAALAWREQTRILAALLRHTGTEVERAKQAAEYALVLAFIEASRVAAERLKQLAEAERLAKLAESERLAAEKEARRKAELKRVRAQRLWFFAGFVMTGALAAWAWQERGHAQTEAQRAQTEAEKSQRAEVQAKQQATRALKAEATATDEAQHAELARTQAQQEAARAVQAEAAAKLSAQQANVARQRAVTAEKQTKAMQVDLVKFTLTSLIAKQQNITDYVQELVKKGQQALLLDLTKAELGKIPDDLLAKEAKQDWQSKLPSLSLAEQIQLIRLVFAAQPDRLSFTALARELRTPPLRVSGTVPDMVSIPAGSFTMGCQDGRDQDCRDHEKPAHKVQLAAFELGKTEVTVGQFRAFIEATNYQTTAEKQGSCWSLDSSGNWGYVKGNSWRKLGFSQTDNDPVACVSWDDSQAMIGWLNKTAGGGYRLPSESEWEYACRAGKDSQYCGGDHLYSVAWYRDNSDRKTHPVGGKQANAWGLSDMSGNVWEWVQDTKHSDYNGAPTNGSSWGGGVGRVLRGGSWDDNPQLSRAAIRDFGTPAVRLNFIGFRLARTPQ